MHLKSGGPRGGSSSNGAADFVNNAANAANMLDQNNSVQSVAGQSVSEHDDLTTLTSKLKAVKRENQQLRNLLR